jgi:hypothetical protein
MGQAEREKRHRRRLAFLLHFAGAMGLLAAAGKLLNNSGVNLILSVQETNGVRIGHCGLTKSLGCRIGQHDWLDNRWIVVLIARRGLAPTVGVGAGANSARGESRMTRWNAVRSSIELESFIEDVLRR